MRSSVFRARASSSTLAPVGSKTCFPAESKYQIHSLLPATCLRPALPPLLIEFLQQGPAVVDQDPLLDCDKAYPLSAQDSA